MRIRDESAPQSQYSGGQHEVARPHDRMPRVRTGMQVLADSDDPSHVINAMKQGLIDGKSFAETYKRTDWSKYEKMPAFKASNRGNAYRIYLELEPEYF